MSTLPFVSVIVPTYNAPHFTDQCLQSLVQQSYPKDKYEVIVVDNASTDNTQDVIQKYPVKMLVQSEFKSPYPSRNMGIEVAKGEIIALIDANCFTHGQWLENAVKALQTQQADLAGTAVVFAFSPEKTGAEIYDALTNIRMKESIEGRNVAKTASLFAYKYVYDKIGLFPPNIRSGGDVRWTRKATDAGFKLIYAGEAIAYKPARKLMPLAKKQLRVGRGQPLIWIEEGKDKKYVFREILQTTIFLLLFKLPGFPFLKRRIKETGNSNDEEMHKKLGRTFMAGWVCYAAMNLGRTFTFVKILFK